MQPNNEKSVLPEVPEYFLYWTFQERFLLKPKLFTSGGFPLKIVSPGTRNSDNGPDFLDAILEINGQMWRGDVEFHLRWQDWFRHGHQHDRRYRQVILHVLWHSDQDIPDSLERKFPHFILSRYLRQPLSLWLEKMRQYQQDRSTRPTSFGGPLPSLSRLKKLAEQRFERKCETVRSWVESHGWETSLYMGLGRALGYSKNSATFTQLIRQLPPSRLLALVPPLQRSPLLFWILLGLQGGLFDRPFPRQTVSFRSGPLQVIRHIERQSSARLPFARQELPQWQFSRLRPPNNPYYRLAGYAQILYHYADHSLFQHLLELFMNREPLHRLLSRVQSALCLPLSPAFRPFFSQLFGFRRLPLKSMGVRRCNLFILNILLPLFHLWAGKQHSEGFASYLSDLFFHFPAVDDNHIIQTFSGRLSGLPRNRAYLQQALLEYYQRSLPEACRAGWA